MTVDHAVLMSFATGRASHLSQLEFHPMHGQMLEALGARNGSVFDEDWLEVLVAAALSGRRMERRVRLLEHGLGYATKSGSGGLILFDIEGNLVKADARAEATLRSAGVELARSSLRIDALDTTSGASDRSLPDWLNADWIEPVCEDGERIGTVVLVPERLPRRQQIQQGGLPGYKLRRVVEFIRAHIDQPLPLEQLAAAAAVSPFHFHRQFKRSTGNTPHQYIVQARMERAKTLLSESDMPLAEVAAQVGFADQSHFTSIFRRTTSMTPLKYRNATSTL